MKIMTQPPACSSSSSSVAVAGAATDFVHVADSPFQVHSLFAVPFHKLHMGEFSRSICEIETKENYVQAQHKMVSMHERAQFAPQHRLLKLDIDH